MLNENENGDEQILWYRVKIDKQRIFTDDRVTIMNYWNQNGPGQIQVTVVVFSLISSSPPIFHALPWETCSDGVIADRYSV